jgi:hypothetical protein
MGKAHLFYSWNLAIETILSVFISVHLRTKLKKQLLSFLAKKSSQVLPWLPIKLIADRLIKGDRLSETAYESQS